MFLIIVLHQLVYKHLDSIQYVVYNLSTVLKIIKLEVDIPCWGAIHPVDFCFSPTKNNNKENWALITKIKITKFRDASMVAWWSKTSLSLLIGLFIPWKTCASCILKECGIVNMKDERPKIHKCKYEGWKGLYFLFYFSRSQTRLNSTAKNCL